MYMYTHQVAFRVLLFYDSSRVRTKSQLSMSSKTMLAACVCSSLPKHVPLHQACSASAIDNVQLHWGARVLIIS